MWFGGGETATGRAGTRIALCVSILPFVAVKIAEAQSSALPIPASDEWLGYDGNWSPVVIQIGTPPQPVNLMPGLSLSEIVVIGTDSCAGGTEELLQACITARGGNFNQNQSSSWEELGFYDSGLDTPVSLEDSTHYGTDLVTLDADLSEADQLVGIIDVTDYWTGVLGLGQEVTGLGSARTPSFLGSLFTNGRIPSLSYGYTAGASYESKQVPSSLVLGGYDASRFGSDSATFTLDSDGHPALGVNSISLNFSGEVQILGEAREQLFTIDSTTPHLWLPAEVADRFGEITGMQYNTTLEVFTYPDDATYEDITSADISLSFELTNMAGEPTQLTITLPGASFTSHNLTYGFPYLDGAYEDPPLPYVPIRRAANSTEFKLGRVFLQESYIIVNYHTNNFTLSQAQFPADSATGASIVNINPEDSIGASNDPTTASTSSSSSSSSGGISTGAKIGIAIGVVALVSALVAIATTIILHRRRHHAHNDPEKSPTSSSSSDSLPPRRGLARLLPFFFGGQYNGPSSANRVSELAAREADPDARKGLFGRRTAAKRPATNAVVEGDPANEIKELPAPLATMIELPGSPVPGATTFGDDATDAARRSSTAKVALQAASPDQIQQQQLQEQQQRYARLLSSMSHSATVDDEEPVPTYESAISSSTSSSGPSALSTGTPSNPFRSPLSSSGMPSPETGTGTHGSSSDGQQTVSSISSLGGENNNHNHMAMMAAAVVAARQPVERPIYTLDDSQTFELRLSELRPLGLVSLEESEMGSRGGGEQRGVAVVDGGGSGTAFEEAMGRRFSWVSETEAGTRGEEEEQEEDEVAEESFYTENERGVVAATGVPWREVRYEQVGIERKEIQQQESQQQDEQQQRQFIAHEGPKAETTDL